MAFPKRWARSNFSLKNKTSTHSQILHISITHYLKRRDVGHYCDEDYEYIGKKKVRQRR